MKVNSIIMKTIVSVIIAYQMLHFVANDKYGKGVILNSFRNYDFYHTLSFQKNLKTLLSVPQHDKDSDSASYIWIHNLQINITPVSIYD